MAPQSLAWPPSVRPQPTICKHRCVEQMADKPDLFAETERFLTAIQDQVILRRNYKKHILKRPETDELCRRCGKKSESIQGITAACEQLAPIEYVKRHDGLAKIIHQKLAEAAELIEDKSPYDKYTPDSVLENENFKLHGNRSILGHLLVDLT